MLSLSRTIAGLRNLSISARTDLKGQKVTSLGKRELSGLSEGSDVHLQDTMDFMLKAHQPKPNTEVDLKGVRYKMRGRFNITKTKWWLEQGPVLIDQVAAINLEYNKPSSDALGMSRGAFDYHNYFICQLRYKNPTVQIDVSTDQVAVPFMTIHFKDGRSTTMNCASSAEEIAAHVQATFCIDNEDAKIQETDENGRIRNPWMHGGNKPCATATKNRTHRKCICQQPGHFGCKTAMHNLVQTPERKALTQRSAHNLPVEDSWYVNYLTYTEDLDNVRGKFNEYRYLRRNHADKRPWRSADSFRSHHNEIKRLEELGAERMVRKLKGTRDFKIIKRMSQKAVHEYWSNWFWQCEPGLGPNIEEMKTELHKRSVYLAQNDLERGGYRQKRPRNRWPPGIPYYA